LDEKKRELLALFKEGSFQCEDEVVVVVKEKERMVVDTAKLRRMAEEAGWKLPMSKEEGRHYVKRG
jgi:hypothetical protein